MKLYGNFFGEIRNIQGFTQDEMLQAKKDITKLQSDKAEPTVIDEYVKGKFYLECIEQYKDYLSYIRNFYIQFLKTKEGVKTDYYYFHLKSEILSELKMISDNLVNMKQNGRNIKRFLKNNTFLDDVIKEVDSINESSSELISFIQNITNEPKNNYDDKINIWLQINKIKNEYKKFNTIPNELSTWDEFKELYNFIAGIDKSDSDKKKRKKKRDVILPIQFQEFFQYYVKKQDNKLDFYTDLLFLLYSNKLFIEGEGEEYVNVIERKENSKALKKLLRPLIKKLIEDNLKSILDEIIELDKDYNLAEKKGGINLIPIFEQNVSIFLPKISDLYFNGLEKKYQAIINTDFDEHKNIIKFYSEKMDIFITVINDIKNKIFEFQAYLHPYDEIMSSLEKVFSNLLDEIERRKDEYLLYLKTIKNERMRDGVRNFIGDKIAEINKLMIKYQDETSLIVRAEFPQLKQIREILDDYKKKVKTIKNEVYKEIEFYKEKNIDIYQIIKQWEDNFTQKRQQLSFLISLLLNKLYKNFKGLIEVEEDIFDDIAEIKAHEDTIENLPLNFALSGFLMDKLTEEELDERIELINAKIKKLTEEVALYQGELANLEEAVINKVKLREGIDKIDVNCTICHKQINFAKAKLVVCPFCKSTYHYLCVAFWLTKYNSCPTCQNQFLDPDSGMYEYEDEE